MQVKDKVKTLVDVKGVMDKGAVGTVAGKDDIERGKTGKVMVNFASGGSLFYDEVDLKVVA